MLPLAKTNSIAVESFSLRKPVFVPSQPSQKNYFKVGTFQVGPNESTDTRYFAWDPGGRKGYAGVLPITRKADGQLYVTLIAINRPAYQRFDEFKRLSRNIELPCGRVEANQTPLQAAQAEVKEEVGITVELDQLISVGTVVHAAYFPQKGEVFITKPLDERSQGPQHLEEDEQLSQLEKIEVPLANIWETLDEYRKKGYGIQGDVYVALAKAYQLTPGNTLNYMA